MAPVPTRPRTTDFPELNDLLAELTDRVSEILQDNLVGVYLQGSFAVGDADLASDCDFLVPVHRQVSSEQEAELRALHDEIPTRQSHWAHHLEGSYPVAAELRSLTGLRRDWLYVDHGWREMQWSTHCNNVVARWSLRERGVTLAGPEPSTLVDPVPVEEMRAFARRSIGSFMADFDTWMTLDLAWGQRYAVSSYCRMLATLDTAEVLSKKAALLWGQEHLDPRWHDLLQAAIDERAEYDPDARANRARVDETRAFAAACERLSSEPGNLQA